MVTREHIENLLKLNGVSVSDSEDQIKSILISAQWHEDDVETAMLVLRENKSDHKTNVSSLHKVFRSDKSMAPEAVSSLLGINMNITSNDIEVSRRRSKRDLSFAQMVLIFGFSIILSVAFIYVGMWYMKVGFFHQTLI